MTAANATPPTGALEAVQELESALAERADARGTAEVGIDAARAEAERLLADARRIGLEAGRRRRDEILAAAAADARGIRGSADAEVQELRERVSAHNDELIAELTALVLPEEAAGACSSR
jgi:hypothetical protein